ncbi:hypothetical protein ACFQPF_12045 [Fictibacillus iocasae]|uniref:TMhelix containing protein n=1 Tax=Fictibacillus iocasae TaxID=2715437 RepID=A0ABW2NUT5_9BACL
MNKDLLEYIKVACLVIMAVSLSVLAWNSVQLVSEIEEVGVQISYINEVLNNMMTN